MTVDLTRGGNHLLHFVCFKVLINPGVSTFPLEKTIIGIFLIYKLLFIFFKLDLGGGGVREITNKKYQKKSQELFQTTLFLLPYHIMLSDAITINFGSFYLFQTDTYDYFIV